MNKARISVLGLSLLLSTVLGNHHFGHHGEQVEHRAIQSRSSKPWPDSSSHWADIPTSDGFHSAITWEAPKISSVASLPEAEVVKRQIPQPAFGSFQQQGYNVPESSLSNPYEEQHATRQVHPGSPFGSAPSTSSGFDQPDFKITKPNFDFGKQYESNPPYQPPTDSYNYKVQFEERPKRQNSVSLPASSPSSRFARPDFEQFRPAEFNQEPSYQPDQQNVRPLRHASYPSTFSEDSRAPSASFDYSPESVPSFDVDYKQPSFSETTKQFKNFFVDHNSNHFNRPSRSSPTYETSYEEPSYEIKRPLTPPTSFEPLPPSTRPINRHSQQKPYGSTISPPRESYDRYIERPKEEVLEPVYDYLQDDEVNSIQKPYDSYRINPPSAPQENFSYKRPDYPQYGLEEPYEYRDEGHENEEEYDRVNEEEKGRYEVKNYRQPIKAKRYERNEPVKVENYGNAYGGVETYKGGYDSESDNEQGIVRYHPYHSSGRTPPSPYERNIEVEDEPIEDYNREGYYVPKEKNYYENQHEYRRNYNNDDTKMTKRRGHPKYSRQSRGQMTKSKPMRDY